MKQVGITTDGKKVMDGVFELSDTHGLPLVVTLQLMKENDMIISPIHYYQEASKAGWKIKTITNRLTEALSDVYGKPHADEVINRLSTYINNL